MRIYKIIENFETKYPNPIILNIGEKVSLKNSKKEEKWKGWIWAENKVNKGWIPKQILEISDNKKTGIALEFYSAKELNVKKGELIEKIKILNGWAWVRVLKTNDEGWIPNEIIK